MIVGYTSGVFDMFHVGHLNILKHAKEKCDFLIVAVSTDEVVETSKHKKTIIPFKDRAQIVEAIKYVDKVVAQETYEINGKIEASIKYNVDIVFVGSDWQGTEKWMRIEEELAKYGKRVVYLPHTDGISSTLLREKVSTK